MSQGKPSRFEPGRLAWRSDIPFSRLLPQVPQRGASNLLCLVMAWAFVLVSSLCIVSPVEAQTGPSLSTIPGLTPPQQATAETILMACPPLVMDQATGVALTNAQIDLKNRCTGMVNNGMNQTNLPETRNALLQVSPEKIPTAGTTQVEAARAQIANVGTRLAALRGGATGISLQGLVFNINGKTLPGTMLASLVPGSRGSDVMSVEEPTIFPRFEAPTNGKTSPRAMLPSLLAQSEGRGTRSADNPSPLGKLGIFVNGTLTLGDKDATSREAGFDFHTLGVTAGVDYRFTDNFVLGAAFGFASTGADLDSSGGSLDTKQYSGSIYGTYYFERLYIDGIATVGRNTFDSKRNIDYRLPLVTPEGMPTGMVGEVMQTAKGDTDGTHYSLGFGAGYDFRSGGFTFGPYGRVSYFKLDIDGFGERIDNTNPGFGFALEFSDQTLESLTTALGGQVTYALSTRVAVFVPQVLFEWVHEFLNNERTIIANFVNDPRKFTLNSPTDNPDRNFFNLGLGLSAVFRGGKSAFIYYQTALGFENITKHDIVLGVRLAF